MVVALGALNALHFHAASVKGAHLNLHLVQSPRGFTAPESGRGAADGAGRNDYYYYHFPRYLTDPLEHLPAILLTGVGINVSRPTTAARASARVHPDLRAGEPCRSRTRRVSSANSGRWSPFRRAAPRPPSPRAWRSLIARVPQAGAPRAPREQGLLHASAQLEPRLPPPPPVATSYGRAAKENARGGCISRPSAAVLDSVLRRGWAGGAGVTAPVLRSRTHPRAGCS